jgi:hypothetical protein
MDELRLHGSADDADGRVDDTVLAQPLENKGSDRCGRCGRKFTYPNLFQKKDSDMGA